ncbi:MAG: hypothetical protein ACYC9J_05515 [Sulfuricaulis sp.]
MDHVWVIGGGPTPQDSQAQIELNVNWIIQVLKGYPGTRDIHVYYTNGPASSKDVVLWQASSELKDTLQPLARVFGEQIANGNHYLTHEVPDVSAGTEADQLKPRLAQEFSALKPGDRALIIFNGHGLHDRDDSAGNTLRLWNDTRLSVYDMDQLLNHINPKVPVRFVFNQCFSGGFERLVHPHAEDSLALNGANRCGFFAVSKDDEAEGCSASVNIGDYRDYTTYFFAALAGHSRTGESIPVNPDLNGDGTVSLYEAHLFALSQAHSTDMPRSTSEVFLERWQPWYLRWIDTGAEPDNVYGRLAREVAKRNGLRESGHALIHEMDVRRLVLNSKLMALEDEQANLDLEIQSIQKEIRKDLGMRWPEALSPYTLNFVHFLKQDLNAAQDYIVSQAHYPDLVAKQNRSFAIDEEILHVNRDITQLDKILRLRELARLQSQFEHHASAQEREWYQRLTSCEGQGL